MVTIAHKINLSLELKISLLKAKIIKIFFECKIIKKYLSKIKIIIINFIIYSNYSYYTNKIVASFIKNIYIY